MPVRCAASALRSRGPSVLPHGSGTVDSYTHNELTMSQLLRAAWVGFLGLSALATAQDTHVTEVVLRTRIADAPPVDTSVGVEPGPDRHLPAAGSIGYRLSVFKAVSSGQLVVRVSLEDASGNELPRSEMSARVVKSAAPLVAFTVCGDRLIAQAPASDRVAQCQDLPPMAKVDSRPDGCIECLGAYEGMPGDLTARSRIAPAGEPGEPVLLKGRVLRPDGSPRPGAIVYAFQTDRTGLYPMPSPPRSVFSQSHGRLRGWALTDAHGSYMFDTIRPGSYPDRTEPAHIHMVVIEPGCSAYFIEDVHFSGDPLLDQVNQRYRATLLNGRGGSGMVTLVRDEHAGTWVANRDIYLGRNYKDYPRCDEGSSRQHPTDVSPVR